MRAYPNYPFHALFSVIEDAADGDVFICGGFGSRMLSGRPLENVDVDCFIGNKESRVKFQKNLSRLSNGYIQSWYCDGSSLKFPIEIEGITINIESPGIDFDSLDTLFSKIDFTACCNAIDIACGVMFVSDQCVSHNKNRILDLSPVYNGIPNVERIKRYIGYGYKPTPEIKRHISIFKPIRRWLRLK